EGSGGNDVLTLNASDVIDFGTGTFDPATAGYDLKDAIKVDGENGDTLNLKLTGGDAWTQIVSDANTPSGYHLYVHSTNAGNLTGAEAAYAPAQAAVSVIVS